MRNIAIADRKDWVFEHPAPPPPPRRPSRLRDALATLPILLLIPALVIPMVMTSAGGPKLKVRPEAPAVGQRMTISGSGFERREKGRLVWKKDGTVVARFKSTTRGRFTLRFRLPRKIGPGMHELLAVNAKGVKRGSVRIEVVPVGQGTDVTQPTTPPAVDADARAHA